MDWLTGIQNAINYIEENLTEKIDYDEAAKQASCSSFYFQRIFSILCGITLGDYIRNRRLTLAGNEFENFNSLNLMDGNYLNIECTLPNGDKTKILDNDTQYYAKQIDIEGSDKCYGVAANEKFIAVYKYGCNGENAELVLWKKI